MKGAKESGVVTIHLNRLVTEYDFEKTRFLVSERRGRSEVNGTEVNDNETSTSQWIEADVILCADGVKSRARGAMLARKGETDNGK